jgi:hypothetical protein
MPVIPDPTTRQKHGRMHKTPGRFKSIPFYQTLKENGAGAAVDMIYFPGVFLVGM